MVNNAPSMSTEMSAATSKCTLPTQNKLAILNLIKHQKDLLFGKFTVEVENVKKIEAWENILNKAKSLNMVTSNRPWTYVRDQLYGGWKTRALKKRDNAKQTGSSGGPGAKLTEVDMLIFDIIGTDTPTINGIQGSESGRTTLLPDRFCNQNDETLMSFNEFAINTDFMGIFSPPQSQNINNQNLPLGTTPVIQTQQGAPSHGNTHEQENQTITKKRHIKVAELVEKKRKLQISVLQLEEYKLKLETFKLEKELNIEHSDMTKDLLEKVLES